MIKLGQMVLKGVICIHNDKIWSNGVEGRQLGRQYKKSGQMVLKGVIWVHNDKTGLNSLEMSQLGTQ